MLKNFTKFLLSISHIIPPKKRDIFIGIVLVLFIAIVLTITTGEGLHFNYREGDIVTEDIKLPFTIEIIDFKKTADKESKIREETPPVFIQDNTASIASKNLLKAIGNLIERKDLDKDSKINQITVLTTNIPKKLLNELCENKNSSLIIKKTEKLLETVTSKGLLNFYPVSYKTTIDEIRITDPKKKRSELFLLSDFYSPLNLNLKKEILNLFPDTDESELKIIIELSKIFLKPNFIYDLKESANQVENRLNSEGPVFTTLRKGHILAKKGDIITSEHIKLFKEISKRSSKGFVFSLWGVVLFYLILTALFIYGAWKFEKRIINLKGYAWVFILFTLFYFLLTLYISRQELLLTSNLPRLLFLPVIIPCLVLPVFFSIPFSVFSLTLLLLLTGFLVQNDILNQVFLFLIGLTGISLRDRFQKTSKAFWIAGFLLLIAQWIILIVAGLTQYFYLNKIIESLWYSGLNAVFSILISFGLISFFESVFNLAIDSRLIELSNLNKPIFKRLLLEAPGTYHHSIMVGNIAEAAAFEIGANPLLVKTAAYYHDIGKLSNPDFFIENKDSESMTKKENLPNPRLYATIVKQHLKDSIEMGKQLRLPEEVLDIISQHHGKSLIKFFYYKALNSSKYQDQTIPKEEFSYEGENPKSKEAVILMLADSVEAASRSIEKPTFNRIRETVEEILNSKFTEGILGESEITFGEIQKICKVFINILTGVFHNRIRYPEDSEIENAEDSIKDQK